MHLDQGIDQPIREAFDVENSSRQLEAKIELMLSVKGLLASS